MYFAAPWWLIGTLPWAVVLVRWMLRRSTASAVPYLHLWQRQTAQRTRPSLRSIPFRVLLVFAATLLAIFTAGQPTIGRRSVTARLLIGNHVNAAGLSPWIDRLGETLRSKSIALQIQFNSATLPTDATNLDAEADVLISAEPVHRNDLIVINLNTIQALEVVAAAFAENPPEWMITLRNNSADESAVIGLGDADPMSQPVTLPHAGTRQSYFVPASNFSRTPRLRITNLNGRDLIPPRTLAAAATAPQLTVANALPPSVERFRSVYAQLHPPTPDSPKISLGVSGPTDRESLWIPPSTQPAITATSMMIVPHAITRHLSSDVLAGKPVNVSEGAGPAWRTVARVNDRSILAVRDEPFRQVWLGFSSAGFEQREEFVTLLADIVGWLNHDDEADSSPDDSDAAAALPTPQSVAQQIEQRVARSRAAAPAICIVSLSLLAAAGLIRSQARKSL